MIETKLGVAAKAAVAVAALTGASAFAQNLPDFTFAPAAAGLTGSNITADNIIISDYSRVQIAADGSFTDTGFLAVSGFQLDGADVVAAGLNSTYGLYFEFSATGTQTTNNPFSQPNSGTFDSLTYTLYGYNGPAATFTPDSTSAVGAVALATGSLIDGSVGTFPIGGSFIPFAGANTSFAINAGQGGFFAAPDPFYGMLMSSFINTTSQVNVISANEFTIFQGGGSVNFAAPIPEPQTYALMLAGLGVVAFIARRRQRV
jgi:hypothetical protein